MWIHIRSATLGQRTRRGSEGKGFVGGGVVGGDEGAKSAVGERSKIGFTGDESTHSSDRVFDAALLPGRVGIAEEGVDRQAAQGEMASELGAIVEGDGLSKWLWHGAKQIDEMASDPVGSLVGQPDRQ